MDGALLPLCWQGREGMLPWPASHFFSSRFPVPSTAWEKQGKYGKNTLLVLAAQKSHLQSCAWGPAVLILV